MPKDAYINARVDKRIKTKAQKVLAKVGLTTTEAVNLYLHQIVLHGGLPFDVRVPNAETEAAIKETRAGKGKVYTGKGREVLQSILKEDD